MPLFVLTKLPVFKEPEPDAVLAALLEKHKTYLQTLRHRLRRS